MDFLNQLMGGGRQQEFKDFTQRYDEGPPYERISDEEAANRYEEVAPHLSEEDYRLSAREAFERMSPEEREEFGRLLREQSQQQGHGDMPGGENAAGNLRDPDYLAQVASRMHQQQPDALGGLMRNVLGSGGGGLVGGMLGSGMTGGGGASGGGGMMSNPAAKAALAGIAATAAKRFMGGR